MTAPADDVVDRLEARLAAGSRKLTHQPDGGHLRATLAARDVPGSSRVPAAFRRQSAGQSELTRLTAGDRQAIREMLVERRYRTGRPTGSSCRGPWA